MKKILYCLISILIMSSCKNDVMELLNPNEITTQTFWKTESDALSALAACYSQLTVPEMWGDRGILIYNGRGDDFFIRNDMQQVYQASAFTNIPDNKEIAGLFSAAYRLIFMANQILDNISQIPNLSDEKIKAISGEAKFLRGLSYFTLVNNFGDVPLHLSVPKTKEDYFLKQSTQVEVWNQIKKDFKDASESLPIVYDAANVGRATKGAALAFLGKAYVYTKDWDAAIVSLLPLTKSPYSYTLVDNFGDNFTIAGENNKESIFAVQFKDEPSALYNANKAEQMFAPAEVKGWFEAFPTNKLFEAFQKEKTIDGKLDPRMYATLVWNYEGAIFYNKPFSTFSTPFPQFIAMFKKYQNYYLNNEVLGSKGTVTHSENDKRIMRYDYVLLMLAESYTQKNQMDGTTGANFYLSQIRKRANLDVTKTIPFNQTQMIEEIHHQYMLEFAREEQRFYDLRRWGLLKEEIVNSDKEGKEFYVTGKSDYFPIPQAEINSNPLIKQNSNW